MVILSKIFPNDIREQEVIAVTTEMVEWLSDMLSPQLADFSNPLQKPMSYRNRRAESSSLYQSIGGKLDIVECINYYAGDGWLVLPCLIAQYRIGPNTYIPQHELLVKVDDNDLIATQLKLAYF